MKRSATFVTLALAGCVPVPEPEIGAPPPIWELAIVPPQVVEPAIPPPQGVIVRPAMDGSLVIATKSGVQIGDEYFATPSFVRVSTAGEITMTSTITTTDPVITLEPIVDFVGMNVADDGAPVIAVFSSRNPWLAGFDAAFREKWIFKKDPVLPFSNVWSMAVGPDGSTVVNSTIVSQPTQTAIRYLDPSGALRWRAPATIRDVAWMSDDGAVSMCNYPDSWQRFSATGVFLNDDPASCLLLIRLSDGGGIFYQPETGELVRIDRAGGTVWKSPRTSGTERFFMSRSGHLFGVTSGDTRVARFDAATGELTASHDNKHVRFLSNPDHRPEIVSADSEGYVLLQESGLVRYAGP